MKKAGYAVKNRVRAPFSRVSLPFLIVGLEVFTMNPTLGQERVTALPVDIKPFGRALCLTDSAETPPKRAQYHNLEAVGSTTYELVFAPENARMNAWLITWYINNRGETGPESAPLSFMVV